MTEDLLQRQRCQAENFRHEQQPPERMVNSLWRGTTKWIVPLERRTRRPSITSASEWFDDR